MGGSTTATRRDGPISWDRSPADDSRTGLDAGERVVASSRVGAGVGRYRVLGEIGRGGMGTVLRAYDPKLQREVALKEVRREILGAEGTARLVAEARAMAQLSHPSVVAVYDVEPVGGRLVLAMEYVPGTTLSAWLGAASRPWREVVGRFEMAGRGLAAAHEAGLLHRDFKPDNVLVTDTTVKVTDFGLAKLDAVHTSPSRSGDDSSIGAVEVSSRRGFGAEGLTGAGTVMGTPRYMAPEQHRAEELTPAADQYAFCVALWEALCGVSPFSVRRIAEQKANGPPPWPHSAVPRPIVAAIRRGLDPDPMKRWPDMGRLLAALRYDPARRHVRRLAALGGAGTLAIASAGAHAWWSQRARQCSGAASQLEGIWDEVSRDRVRDAVEGIEAEYASGVWTRVSTALDDYTERWTRMHAQTCEATTIRGEQSTEVMDLRMACLQRSRMDLRAVTDVLATADPQVVARAHRLVEGLPHLERCADVEALRADVETPLPRDAAAVEEIREHLAAAAAARKAGRYEAAWSEVEAARARRQRGEVQYELIDAELALEEGYVQERLGRFDEADAALRRALAMGASLGHQPTMGAAATRLLLVVGHRLHHADEALSYAELALGVASSDPDRDAGVRTNVAIVHSQRGDYGKAERQLRRALAIKQEALGAQQSDFDLAIMHSSLGNILANQGRHAEAYEELNRSFEVQRELLGPDHPEVITAQSNLTSVLFLIGRRDEAEANARHSLEARRAAFGPDHPDVGSSHNNLAVIFEAKRDFAAAEAEYRHALEIWRRAFGSDHPEVAKARSNLAIVLVERGRLDEAESEYRQALRIEDARLGADHPAAARTRSLLAGLLLDRGRAGEALPLLEAAWRRHERDDVPPQWRAETAMTLAQTLASESPDHDPERALRMAQRALSLANEAGAESFADRIAAWIRRHGAP